MRKKKIILIIIAIVIIAIAILYVLYLKTDLFKNEQQLFWKYAVKSSDISKIFNNENVSDIENKKINNSYKSESNLDITTENGLYKITSETNAKNANDICTYVKFTKDSNEIVDFNLVKKSNVVGLKMDELANGYITLKNSNLKSLAEKIELENTEMFPENVNWSSYMDVLNISDDDVNYITNKYSEIIIADTSKENYSKDGSAGIKINDKIHTATAYKLTLSENEVKKILTDVFINISKDSRTLNLISSKLKILNVPSEYTQINLLSDKFLEISNNINLLETTDDEFIQITIYEEKSELIQVNFEIDGERLIKIVYDQENNKITVKQELLSDNLDNKFIEAISDSIIKIINKIEEIDIENVVSDSNNTMSTNIDVICNNDITINFSSLTQITNDVQISDDYENSTKIILNDLNEKQLKNLYNAIIKTVSGIYQDKKEILGIEN